MRLKSLDRLRGHPLFIFAHLRAGAVSRTEDASGAAGAVHSLWSRLFCGPLEMRRVPEKPVLRTEFLRKRLPCRKRGFSCTECPFRTVEACFLHRMLLKMRRVPQEAFLSTARIFRTIGGPLRYRMPDRGRLPPQRSLANILVDLVYRQQHRHY